MTSLVLASEERDARRRASLQQRGYEHVRDIYGMRMDLAPGRPPASWPAGIEVRPIRPGVDDRAAHAASEEAFAEHYLFGPQPFEEWRACTLERNECDPSLWLLAWDGGEVAGQVWALARDEGGPALVGLVEDLSVCKPWRGRGLGLLGDRGCASVRLWVDAQNTTGALRVYERAGMRQERHVMDFERPLAS
jgi:GNAT superfamily N-acetyltransferase